VSVVVLDPAPPVRQQSQGDAAPAASAIDGLDRPVVQQVRTVVQRFCKQLQSMRDDLAALFRLPEWPWLDAKARASAEQHSVLVRFYESETETLRCVFAT